jgi:hypothetical protein
LWWRVSNRSTMLRWLQQQIPPIRVSLIERCAVKRSHTIPASDLYLGLVAILFPPKNIECSLKNMVHVVFKERP